MASAASVVVATSWTDSLDSPAVTVAWTVPSDSGCSETVTVYVPVASGRGADSMRTNWPATPGMSLASLGGAAPFGAVLLSAADDESVAPVPVPVAAPAIGAAPEPGPPTGPWTVPTERALVLAGAPAPLGDASGRSAACAPTPLLATAVDAARLADPACDVPRRDEAASRRAPPAGFDPVDADGLAGSPSSVAVVAASLPRAPSSRASAPARPGPPTPVAALVPRSGDPAFLLAAALGLGGVSASLPARWEAVALPVVIRVAAVEPVPADAGPAPPLPPGSGLAARWPASEDLGRRAMAPALAAPRWVVVVVCEPGEEVCARASSMEDALTSAAPAARGASVRPSSVPADGRTVCAGRVVPAAGPAALGAAAGPEGDGTTPGAGGDAPAPGAPAAPTAATAAGVAAAVAGVPTGAVRVVAPEWWRAPSRPSDVDVQLPCPSLSVPATCEGSGPWGATLACSACSKAGPSDGSAGSAAEGPGAAGAAAATKERSEGTETPLIPTPPVCA